MSVEWHKSTRSGAVGNCVEVASAGGATLIRDSKQPHGARLRVSRDRWRGFVAWVGAGSCDQRSSAPAPE